MADENSQAPDAEAQDSEAQGESGQAAEQTGDVDESSGIALPDTSNLPLEIRQHVDGAVREFQRGITPKLQERAKLADENKSLKAQMAQFKQQQSDLQQRQTLAATSQPYQPPPEGQADYGGQEGVAANQQVFPEAAALRQELADVRYEQIVLGLAKDPLYDNINEARPQMDARRQQLFRTGQVLPQDVYWAEVGPGLKRELLTLRKELADLRGGAAAATQGSGGARAKSRPVAKIQNEERADLLKQASGSGTEAKDAALKLIMDRG